jgi:hypothetical protein
MRAAAAIEARDAEWTQTVISVVFRRIRTPLGPARTLMHVDVEGHQRNEAAMRVGTVEQATTQASLRTVLGA